MLLTPYIGQHTVFSSWPQIFLFRMRIFSDELIMAIMSTIFAPHFSRPHPTPPIFCGIPPSLFARNVVIVSRNKFRVALYRDSHVVWWSNC